MRKSTFSQWAIISFLLLAFIATSCEDKDYFDPDYTDPTVSEEPSKLDFSTTQEVVFNFNYNVPNGFISRFEVYSENPFSWDTSNGVWVMREGIESIAAGINVAGSTETRRNIPAYVKNLYVYSPSLFVPMLMQAEIKNGIASFKEIEGNDTRTQTRTIGDFGVGQVDYYLREGVGAFNSSYRPNVIDKTEVIPAEVLTSISEAFPEHGTADPKYYADATIELLQEENKGAGIEVYVSLLHSEGMNVNSLSYFCFNGTKEELSALTKEERDAIPVIAAFQYAKLNKSDGNALQPGQYIQLKYWDGAQLVDKFPVNTTIGWILHSNGFNGSNYGVKGNSISNPWFYSVAAWNPEPNPNKKNHTIIFTTTDKNGEEYVCFGYEDLLREQINGQGQTYDEDCNDLIFHVKTNPANAIDPPPYIPTPGIITKKEEVKGILAFEDNWPRKGDYDMNDVVIGYYSTINYIQKTEDGTPIGDQYVSRVDDKFSIMHTGASYYNIFRYKVEGINASSIQEITINDASYSPVADGNGFIITVDERKIQEIIPAYTLLEPKDYVVYNVEIIFKEGEVKVSDFNKTNPKTGMAVSKAPYNPYISPSPHIQVHLPNYTPVFDANMNSHGLDLFGRHADRSKTNENGIWNWAKDDNGYNYYYIGGANLAHPFAINLSGITEFIIPVERMEIDYTYPDYTGWVDNGCGDKYADWYTKPDKNKINSSSYLQK